jgi:hypothetical protein
LLGYLKHHYRPMKFRAPKELRVIAMFDSDWATDKNDRRSIASYLTTIGGTALVNWQSKKQQTVALSSCESETMAGTVCAQDVLFTMNLLEELVGDKLLKPSYIYGDNVASLFLAQNNSVSQRTKHIDIRYHFMNELVESKCFELRHVRTEENTSDINSKNTKVDIHKKMADRMYSGLVVAQVEGDDGEESDAETPKEDVGYSNAIVVGDSAPSNLVTSSILQRSPKKNVTSTVIPQRDRKRDLTSTVIPRRDLKKIHVNGSSQSIGSGADGKKDGSVENHSVTHAEMDADVESDWKVVKRCSKKKR